MIQTRSVWVARGDTSLAGLNALLKEWVITPEQLVDIEPQRNGPDWTILYVRFDTTVVPKLLTSTIHQGAWFLPAYRPAKITLVFNTPIAQSSIETGTFKLVYASSEFSVPAGSVSVDKELVTINLSYPAPGYVGPVTLIGSGFESETGGDAGDAVNLQFALVDANHLPPFTPANHGQTSSVFRYGALRAARIMVPFGGKPDTMLRSFLVAKAIQPSQLIKSIFRGSAQAGYTDLFVVWYPLAGIRLVAASPSAWLASETAVDRILVNFDQPVELTADQVSVEGPGGTVSVTPVAMDARKTQWKLTGAFTTPGQYHVILDSVRNTAGDYVPFRHAFGWQVMPTEIDTGVTDHGALSGLPDDDHPQYALADGSRGNFDASGAAAAAQTAAEAYADALIAAHLAASDPHPQYLRQSEADALYDALGAAAAALVTAEAYTDSVVAAHVAASDPHAQYQKESEKDAASGYAGLDSSSRVTKEIMLIQAGTVASRPGSGTQGGHLYFATDAVYNGFTGRAQIWIP